MIPEKFKHNKIFDIIYKVSIEHDIETFVVGGYVRDLLLNIPNKDIDIMVIGSGVNFAELVSQSLDNVIKKSYFPNFGTAMIKYLDDNNIPQQIEFVGSRKESYDRKSRKPIVENGTFLDDVSRRDFTINAMAISLGKNYGELIDIYNGVNDLNDNMIKTPVDANITFSDDPLRMLRAIRFATKLNYQISDETYQAIKNNKDRIKIISNERIRDELNKILSYNKPSIGFRLLLDTGLLEIILPEVYKLSEYHHDSVDKHHKDIFEHTMTVLDNVASKSDKLYLRWTALLHDIGKPYVIQEDDKNSFSFHKHEYIGVDMISDIFHKLSLSLDEAKYVSKLIQLHHRPNDLVKDDVSDSAIRRFIYDVNDDLDDLFILYESDITTKYEEKKKLSKEKSDKLLNRIKEIKEKDAFLNNFKLAVNGNDIINIFHIEGKEVGKLKKYINDIVINGLVNNNKEDIIDYVKINYNFYI